MASSSTFIAIAIGGVVGGLAAVLASPGGQVPPNPSAGQPPFEPIAKAPASQLLGSGGSPVAPESTASSHDAVPGASASSPAVPMSPKAGVGAEPKAAGAQGDLERFFGLFKGPHARKVRDKHELEAARLGCAEKKPDECMRAADAYLQGNVSYPNKAEGEQFQKVALSLYVKQCEGTSPGACYSLARMFHEGDLIAQNDAQVSALVERVYYLCERSTEPLCAKLPEPRTQH